MFQCLMFQCLMKLLDSFGDDSDRIIVATTNNPDKIPQILLRPGRFDKIICLSYCSFEMFVNIVKGRFNEITELINDDEFKKNIQEILKLNITPLILINTCVTTNTIDELLNKVGKMKQNIYDKDIKL